MINQLGGVGGSSGLVAKLLPILAPIVLAYLGKQMGQSGGAGAGGGVLGSILGSILSRRRQRHGAASGSSGLSSIDLGDILGGLGGLLGGGAQEVSQRQPGLRSQPGRPARTTRHEAGMDHGCSGRGEVADERADVELDRLAGDPARPGRRHRDEDDGQVQPEDDCRNRREGGSAVSIASTVPRNPESYIATIRLTSTHSCGQTALPRRACRIPPRPDPPLGLAPSVSPRGPHRRDRERQPRAGRGVSWRRACRRCRAGTRQCRFR